MTTYTFEMECPYCGWLFDVETGQDDPPPIIHCERCLEQHRSHVELTIVRITVNGASHHHVRNQKLP